ncbi:MAG TPA: peptidylprolyl isomerase [Bryobacteraceae bacterium]|nr:peptidylprolyl isomerase [Bryobacteraceae bacterium]
MSRSLIPAALLALGFTAVVSCRHAVPDNVAATVNGHVITYAELDKQYQMNFMSSNEKPSEDQAQIQKLELLRTMIDNEIMLQRAEKLGLLATDADVDAKIGELKAPYTQEEFQKQLSARHMSLDDLKAQLRRELSVQKLLNKEIAAHISISDKDVTDFYNANKSSFNFPEPQVRMAQIVVTSNPDPNVRNLKNDKAQNDDQAKKKIDMIQARLRQGDDFVTLAQNFSEDPNTAPNGGDLGFIGESALERASSELRKSIMAMTPGQITPIIHTAEGYRIMKVISKEPAGQRELTDPRVQQNIREILHNRKDQLLRAAYYEMARNESKVVDYLAQSITQEKDKH